MNYSKLSSAGGKATAIILRKKSLEKYYENPIFCKNCNELIHIKENEKVSNVKKRKFCSSSCSATFNNIGITRVEKKIKKPKNKRFDISDLTKEDVFKRYSSYQSARSSICKHARRVYFKSGKEKKCLMCGYDIKIEIAHIKSVSSFSSDSKISEINDINNLLALCPNHHSEFDDGLIKIQIAG
jgi:DNA-directed RNA polymerase subunit M/transcription elongation factor TFIIS